MATHVHVINLPTLTCCNMSPELCLRGRRLRLCSTSSCFTASEKSITKVNFPVCRFFSSFFTSTTVTLTLLESRQTQHDVGTDQCMNDYPPYSGAPLRPFSQMMKTVAFLTRILSFCVRPRSIGPMC